MPLVTLNCHHKHASTWERDVSLEPVKVAFRRRREDFHLCSDTVR